MAAICFTPPYPPHWQDRNSQLPTLTHTYPALPTLTHFYPALPTVTGKRPPPSATKGIPPHACACAHVYLHARAQTSMRPRAQTHLDARTACTYIPVHMHACTRRRARVNALLQGPLPLLLAPDHTSSDLWNPEPWIHTFISWGRRNGA